MANLRRVYDLQGSPSDEYCRAVDDLDAGDVLRRLRKSMGYRRQADLADAADVSRDTYGKAERGLKVSPTIQQRIARALKVPTDAIWTPPVSPEIHKTAQTDTMRAGVPRISGNIPPSSEHADPRKADVLEDAEMRDLQTRLAKLSPNQLARWRYHAALLISDILAEDLSPGSDQPKTG